MDNIVVRNAGWAVLETLDSLIKEKGEFIFNDLSVSRMVYLPSKMYFYSSWAILETIDSFINWLINKLINWLIKKTRPKVYRFGLRDKQKETKETKERKETKETKEKRKEEKRKEKKRKKEKRKKE